MECINLKPHVFEEVLRKGLGEETVEVVGIRNDSTTEKGVNFLSDFFKISILYRVGNGRMKLDRSVNAVVKMEPLNGVSSLQMVQDQDLFGTELRFLRDVLPEIQSLVGQELGPCLWYGCNEPSVLVMEDLTKRGFAMKDRQKGLGLHHCLLVLEQMAKLHAGSVALFERDPERIASFNGGIVSSSCPEYYLRLIEVSAEKIGRDVSKWSDEKCARAGRKLMNLAGTIRRRCLEVYHYDSDEFCVLNHGDCWVNNMMFKENERGQPHDIRLVDFQMSVYTSPAVDLLYFLYTCPEISIKCTNDDFFLETYLTSLEASMTSIGCKTKPPTMEQLKEAIRKRRIYAVFAGIVLYLRMIMNKEDTETFDRIRELGGETQLNVFKNPRCVRAVEKMFPFMDERGYLD